MCSVELRLAGFLTDSVRYGPGVPRVHAATASIFWPLSRMSAHARTIRALTISAWTVRPVSALNRISSVLRLTEALRATSLTRMDRSRDQWIASRASLNRPDLPGDQNL